MTRICVSVSATDIPELLGRVQRAERMGADIVEVRLDKLRSYHGLAKIVRSIGKPLIATNRPLSEKGSYGGSEDDRLKVITQAVEEGFTYADLEVTTRKIQRTTETLKGKGAKIILSHHDYFRTPDQSSLQATFKKIQEYKPDLTKIVTTAQTPNDTLTILGFLHMNQKNGPLVSFAMGQGGIWSRVLSPFYGSDFVYASLERGLETASGQPTIAELRRIYELLDLD